ncbi:uncharacterized protein LOC117320424, partial [Pecten maximus]|uniref:uncharacterized protein LOC117320424 n=1 Tax=Pecten maximus TaxID=6579 RepID=UPI001458F60E
MLRVADLFHHNEADKAGEILTVLATEILAKCPVGDFRSKFIVRDLDMWITCFVLSFDGDWRKRLLEVLKGTNCELVTGDDKEDEEENLYRCRLELRKLFPFIKIPKQEDIIETTAVGGDTPERKSLFYNSLRAEKFPVVSLRRLEKGDFTPEISEEPIQVMLFRFHSLTTLGSCKRGLSHDLYGVLLLRKCIQTAKGNLPYTNDSSSFHTFQVKADPDDDMEAGPSQPKSRRMESIPFQQLNNTTGLSMIQLAFVILNLCEQTDISWDNEDHIRIMVEATLCLETLEKNLPNLSKHLWLFDNMWGILLSVISESIKNKSFIRLYSSLIKEHLSAPITYY